MLSYLLEWYNLCGRGKTELSLLSWREIESWSRMTGIDPRPWELDALLRLDGVWLSVMSEKGHTFEDLEDGVP